jgi:esterase
MTPDLYVKHVGEGPPVILLHGLFGAGGNLGALARALQDKFSVYSVDLPGHGRSSWLDPLSLPAMAEQLSLWMTREGLLQAHLVGHSLGGKVAMQLALEEPERVRALVVADIAPVAYSAHHESVFAALGAVDNAHCTSREEAIDLMSDYLQAPGMIRFLAASLQRSHAGLMRWRFDLHRIQASYAALLAAPPEQLSFPGPVLFIKGGDSNYLQESHWPIIQRYFPAAVIKIMPGCEHWLHVEKPQLFNALVARFLASL